MIIHDLSVRQAGQLFQNKLHKEYLAALEGDDNILLEDGAIRNCIGCFGCWVKTPGRCVLKDAYSDMGAKLGSCSQLLIVSKCCYGGFSPFVKNVLDRSISYILPDFSIRNGEMHHKHRYTNSIQLKVVFYGDEITKQEKETAMNLVKANAINFNCKVEEIIFLTTNELMEGVQ